MDVNAEIAKVIAELESDGDFVEEYPVDEDMLSPNAGHAVIYRYQNHLWQVITWCASGIKEVADLGAAMSGTREGRRIEE